MRARTNDYLQNSHLEQFRGQVHENYIIAQTEDSVVIVDRFGTRKVSLRKTKKEMENNGVKRQVFNTRSY